MLMRLDMNDVSAKAPSPKGAGFAYLRGLREPDLSAQGASLETWSLVRIRDKVGTSSSFIKAPALVCSDTAVLIYSSDVTMSLVLS